MQLPKQQSTRKPICLVESSKQNKTGSKFFFGSQGPVTPTGIARTVQAETNKAVLLLYKAWVLHEPTAFNRTEAWKGRLDSQSQLKASSWRSHEVHLCSQTVGRPRRERPLIQNCRRPARIHDAQTEWGVCRDSRLDVCSHGHSEQA